MTENTGVKALLLVGSPRLAKSTSHALGSYLLSRLQLAGVESEVIFVQSALRSAETQKRLVATVARTDLVILASPLYVDCPPAPVIRLLEVLARGLHEHTRPDHQRLLAIFNCGFPEAHHNDTALAIAERFANEEGFSWVGGLALGGGEPVKNQVLVGGGGMVRNVVHALDMSAEALARGQPVPPRAQDLMREPLMPPALYRAMGNLGWRLQARKQGQLRRLRSRVWSRS
jgi:hypothetical protein